MARFVFIVSLVTAVFFTVLFCLTFVSRSYLIGFARDYVIDRTERYATRAVDVAERAVRTPGARRLMDDQQEWLAAKELSEYRQDPRAYIAKLVATLPAPALRVSTSSATIPTGREKGRDVIGKLKDGIRDHFARTFRRLLIDLRIFTGTNVVAAVLAAALATRWRRRTATGGDAAVHAWETDGRAQYLAWVAALLLASLAFSSYQYVNHLSYFTILLNSYLGWWYPLLLTLTFLRIWWEYGRR